ncbi:UDP-Glycosyltransferase/glycogen phosphorylase [Wilcoxina mikolae CBS 423.85]|nr:UDP-Glycosyltransferase/glycogen phosphorylase [Wilcoxina mikolae CBS 423.85]
MSSPKKRILFIHPDLGIGGAERLVVDAAVGLQDRGHNVTIYTSHCDPRHCFDEARNGTLTIRVAGNSIIPPNILGRFSILCAILRQLHLTLSLLLSGEVSAYDCLFIDQLSACIPLFHFFAPRISVLFYCHFPDYLLASRRSLVKSLYRIPFDWIEGFTTGLADTIVVNSNFTKSVFATAFPKIKREPRVVYPCVDVSSDQKGVIQDCEPEFLASDGRKILLSINRFERKKNIELAIKAFAHLTDQERKISRLIIAGGYDPRVNENISYHNELVALCETFNLKHITCKNFITSLSIPGDTDVLFLLSIPASWKTYLLKAASLLLYTPEREHFGIVPLEALIAELPVLAHNSGGPLETIQEGVTGWLRPEIPEEWTTMIRKALFEMQPAEIGEMGKRGRERVVREFSKEKMAERLEREFDLTPAHEGIGFTGILLFVGGIMVGVGVGLMLLF